VRVNDTTVAVNADTWCTQTGLDALPIVWDEGDTQGFQHSIARG